MCALEFASEITKHSACVFQTTGLRTRGRDIKKKKKKKNRGRGGRGISYELLLHY